MNKKITFILIIGVILVIIGAYGYLNLSEKNRVNIDGTKFEIPNGYHVLEKDNSFNITNNNNSIIIGKKATGNINKSADKYIKEKKNANISVKLSKINLDNIPIYQVTENNPAILHYWFEANGKVYEIGCLDADSNTDYLIKEMIKSTKSFI